MRFILLLTVIVYYGGARATSQEAKEGFEGESLTLECTPAQNAEEFSWRDPKLKLIVQKTREGLRRGRQWPRRKAILENGNLRINTLKLSRDNGDFTCEASGNIATINVTVLARISDVQIREATDGVITVVENRGRRITCEVEGKPNPPPTIEWWISKYHAGTYSTEKYTLSGDRSLDGETVRCQATNRHWENGTVISSSASLATIKVLYIDNPTVPETNITVKNGENVVLRCSAKGNPPPTFAWTKTGSSEVIGWSADHTIEGVETSAAGEYTCSVSNSEGRRNVSLRLAVVAGPPNAPGTSAGLAVGVVIGSLLLVVGVLVLGVVLWRRKTRGCGVKKSDQDFNLGRTIDERAMRSMGFQPSYVNHGQPDTTLPEYVNTQTDEGNPPGITNAYERLGDHRNDEDGRYEPVASGPRGESDPGYVAPVRPDETDEADLPVVTNSPHQGDMQSTDDGVYHHYEDIQERPTPVR